MTPIADMLEQMVADGVPMKVIILAVRTAEITAAAAGKSGGIPVDTAAEKRRAYDRERKAEKRNSGGKSGGIPPDNSNALSSLENNSSQNPTGKKEKKEEATRRKIGHALPDDWNPSESHYRLALERGRTRADVDAKAEEVRMWAKANEHRAVARKSDWNAMFTGCLSRDWPKGAPNGQQSRNNRTSRGAEPTGQDAILAGVGRIADRIRERGDAERRDREVADGDDAPRGNVARLF